MAIARVEEMGGSVGFDGKTSSGLEISWWKKTNDTLFGERVHFLSLNGTEVSKEQIDELKLALPNCRIIR